ncbi:hypothetical protein BHE74_00052352 [Ensete ventricosum]|nr:hypothetical protein BHE74_00052352 [Ensete ventricosum]
MALPSNRAYFGPSNKDFHVTFPKPSRHIRLNSDQGLGKKHYPGPPLEELRSTSVDKSMVHSSTEKHDSSWRPHRPAEALVQDAKDSLGDRRVDGLRMSRKAPPGTDP